MIQTPTTLDQVSASCGVYSSELDKNCRQFPFTIVKWQLRLGTKELISMFYTVGLEMQNLEMGLPDCLIP